MQKDTRTALLFCGVFVGLLVLTVALRTNMSGGTVTGEAIVENGRQTIDIAAKGGYTPNYIEAKAGVPTDLRVLTNGTYDCSSSILIPSLGYQKMLEATGVETVSLTAEQAQGTLEGTCGMGMYRFQIAFK